MTDHQEAQMFAKMEPEAVAVSDAQPHELVVWQTYAAASIAISLKRMADAFEKKNMEDLLAQHGLTAAPE